MAQKKQAKKRKKRDNKLTMLAALGGFLLVVLCIAVAFTLKSNKPGTEPDSSSNSGGQQLTEASTTKKTGEQTTDKTTEQSTATTTKKETTTQPGTTKKTSSGSFYSGVAYRSPVAKTADINKHGRTLMLVNKEWELPENFQWNLVYWSNGQPVDAMSLNSKQYDSVKAVDKEAYPPLKNMFAAAESAGVPLQLVSAYRSIDLQDRLFTRSVNNYMGQGYSKENAIKKANYERTFTGTSEHNVGLGFDILQKGNFTLSNSFENSAHFKWLQEHAEEYGFILRYAKDKVSETGIMYEPWHYRYVGVENAKKINELNMCLEEYIEYIER